MRRASTVSLPKGVKVVVHPQKTEPVPVRPESIGCVRETPRTNKAAYEYECAHDDPDRDAIRWCNLLNESRKLEIELIEANEEKNYETPYR